VPLLDDQTLSALLHELGDSFAVPPSGATDTLLRVRRGDAERSEPEQGQTPFGPAEAPATPRTIRGAIQAHRLLAVAAALVVLVAIAGGAFSLRNTTAPRAGLLGATAPEHRSALSAPPKSISGSASSKGFGVAAPKSASRPSDSAGTASPALSQNSSGTTGTSSQSVQALPNGAVGQPALIQQTGSLDLTVAKDAFATTMAKLNSLAATYNGFVANSQTQSSTTDGAPGGTVVLQIPVANFSAALTAAESLGKVSGLTTKATDVTAQYVDLQSRITALEDSRQQYLTIMTKASSIGDVLAVQAQLDSLQSQIEQLQGQLNVLASETSYSTLTVQASELVPVHHHTPPAALSGVAKAWHDSVHGFVEGAEGLLRAGGPLLFALLCLVALYLGGRLSWRRLQRRSL
jgi:hypothetical protein